jgi:hypothetical protein
MIILVAGGLAFQAPIEHPANPSRTPNPSKAPWYFLGLQEMLVYYDPWLAGVVFPSLIIVGLMAIPYIDTNPKGNGYYTFAERKTEIELFLFGFLILWVLLVILGTFLRGPNWNIFGPYEYWDIHKLEALVNVNLQSSGWALKIGLPQNMLVRGTGSLLSNLPPWSLPGLLADPAQQVLRQDGRLALLRLRDAAARNGRPPRQDDPALDHQPEVHRGHAGNILQHLGTLWPKTSPAATRRWSSGRTR